MTGPEAPRGLARGLLRTGTGVTVTGAAALVLLRVVHAYSAPTAGPLDALAHGILFATVAGIAALVVATGLVLVVAGLAFSLERPAAAREPAGGGASVPAAAREEP